MFVNPTGGLRWHWKAWRAQARWATTCQQLSDWLLATSPSAQTLVIMGSSAGWMLPSSWLARFEHVHTWDIDPLAGRLFAWRHGGALARSGTRLSHHHGDGLQALAQKVQTQPEALYWFDNVLGQLRFLTPDNAQVEARLRNLRHELRGARWGSVHDRLSGPALDTHATLPPPWHGQAGWADEDPRVQAWLQRLQARSPWGDHLTRDVLPAGTPTLNLAWAIAPGHHHWLEAGWVMPSERFS